MCLNFPPKTAFFFPMHYKCLALFSFFICIIHKHLSIFITLIFFSCPFLLMLLLLLPFYLFNDSRSCWWNSIILAFFKYKWYWWDFIWFWPPPLKYSNWLCCLNLTHMCLFFFSQIDFDQFVDSVGLIISESDIFISILTPLMYALLLSLRIFIFHIYFFP